MLPMFSFVPSFSSLSIFRWIPENGCIFHDPVSYSWLLSAFMSSGELLKLSFMVSHMCSLLPALGSAAAPSSITYLIQSCTVETPYFFAREATPSFFSISPRAIASLDVRHENRPWRPVQRLLSLHCSESPFRDIPRSALQNRCWQYQKNWFPNRMPNDFFTFPWVQRPYMHLARWVSKAHTTDAKTRDPNAWFS